MRGNGVRVYVCGLTPSAQAHVGHARSFLFFDLLRRYLKHCGYRVTYVQNVTDIDDRSIAQAAATGADYHAIIEAFYAEFKDSMRKLGVLEPDIEPYATHYIPQIQAMIRALIEGGHAYVSRDGIYYRVATFERYGKLANRNIEELEAGARIEVDEKKEDPLDFALWKFSKPGEPRWAFDPYGEGRPGWHIECSAMSHELLDPDGVGFDIHGGGADLIFPHHENEIAQSEVQMAHPPMANVWLHGGLLLLDGKKMSKSLGNFEPLSDLLKRHDPQAIRMLFLRTGYRKVMNFTESSLASAYADLQSLKRTYRMLRANPADSAPVRSGALLAKVEAALDDDMNTAVALAELLHLEAAGLDEYSTALELLGLVPNDAWLEEPPVELPLGLLARLQVALGGVETFVTVNGATPEQVLADAIAARAAARARKDWAASDRVRDALLGCGIELKDSKDGTTWSLVG